MRYSETGRPESEYPNFGLDLGAAIYPLMEREEDVFIY